MIRFFVGQADIYGDKIKLSAEDTAHIRSLRLQPSESFVVCDGKGTDYVCRLGDRDPGNAEIDHSAAVIVGRSPSAGEPSVSCVVYIALAKGDRLDYAVQKSVELGASAIVLFPSARCIAVPGDMGKKTVRLQRIALETAKQSGRGCIPSVTAAGSFDDAVKQAANAQTPLFFYECEDKTRLKDALLNGSDDYSIMTGPEGGFEPFEADLARASGMVSVSLGSRILRCETAPAAVLSAIMFITDNL